MGIENALINIGGNIKYWGKIPKEIVPGWWIKKS